MLVAFLDRLRLPGLVPLTAGMRPELRDQLPPPHVFFSAAVGDSRLVYTTCTVQTEVPFVLAFMRPSPSIASASLRAMALIHRYAPNVHTHSKNLYNQTFFVFF